MYVDDDGAEWQFPVMHSGALLKLVCPCVTSCEVAGLIVTGPGSFIEYMDRSTPRQPWNPDPVEGYLRVECPVCGKYVGAEQSVLRREVMELLSSNVNEDTFSLEFLGEQGG